MTTPCPYCHVASPYGHYWCDHYIGEYRVFYGIEGETFVYRSLECVVHFDHHVVFRDEAHIGKLLVLL